MTTHRACARLDVRGYVLPHHLCALLHDVLLGEVLAGLACCPAHHLGIGLGAWRAVVGGRAVLLGRTSHLGIKFNSRGGARVNSKYR